MKWVGRSGLRWSEGGLEQDVKEETMSPFAVSTGGARQAHGSLKLQGAVWGRQREGAVGTQKSAGCREGERPCR